ncbi:DUF4334 domain-containing protein [Rhizobium ruizarguesonis]|nr:DUF4334 domain-containing protein [Rhizobium ruizarguesonis]
MVLLAGISPASDLVGLWRGVGIPSGHRLDGVLENLRWTGKRFHPDFRADGLLFQWRPDSLVPIEPSFLPIRLAIRIAPFGRTFVARTVFPYLQNMLRARGTTASAKLRMVDGEETAAMVYDKQQIVDYYRRIDDHEVAGMMCVEGDERRYFFRLRKVEPSFRDGVA